MTIVLSAVELPILEDARQYFYLLWSCLHGKTHDNTVICCGVVSMGGCITILHLLWSCVYWRMHVNTFICCRVVYMGRRMTILLSAVELSQWEDA